MGVAFWGMPKAAQCRLDGHEQREKQATSKFKCQSEITRKVFETRDERDVRGHKTASLLT